jgi:hypothetical protein
MRPAEEAISIRFVEGKTSLTLGPYTVHLLLPTRMADHLRALLIARSRSTFLFPTSTQSIVARALKCEGLEIRSIRRGAAQTLARPILVAAIHGRTALLSTLAASTSSTRVRGTSGWIRFET